MPPREQMLDRKENALRKHLVEHFDLVDHALWDALASLKAGDKELARSVMDKDRFINSKHHQVENECVELIAQRQPVARDLRELLSDMHISAELERIADYAAGIAKTVIEMEDKPAEEIRDAVAMMGKHCRDMLTGIREAYETRDSGRAREIAQFDDTIDAAERELVNRVFEHQDDNPADYRCSTRLLWITHTLERIGDRITNIAERVVFIETGARESLN